MPNSALRLGDVADDYCPRCRLLLNHDIAALIDGEIAKVTCRTCHNEHDYKHAQVPAKRKVKKTQEKLVEQVLAGMPRPPQPPAAPQVPERKKRDLWAEYERVKKQQK